MVNRFIVYKYIYCLQTYLFFTNIFIVFKQVYCIQIGLLFTNMFIVYKHVCNKSFILPLRSVWIRYLGNVTGLLFTNIFIVYRQVYCLQTYLLFTNILIVCKLIFICLKIEDLFEQIIVLSSSSAKLI